MSRDACWPNDPEFEALLRLLACEPPVVQVPAAQFEAAGSLRALVARLPKRAVSPARLEALRRDIVGWRRATGGALLAHFDADYPALLRHTSRPPLALFVLGDPDWLARPSVAIVGARAASGSALAWTRDVAADLGRCGIVVASGLARGIDAAAHLGALESGGATFAVLGCGPDGCYPPEHAALQRRIVERGCIATELPPGTPPRAWHFPLRNRILAGLVSGVVVVQAEPKSGALVTARHAIDENRAVMAVPGDVMDPRSVGPHRLLREGAALVDGAADILEALGWLGLGLASPRPGAEPTSTESGVGSAHPSGEDDKAGFDSASPGGDARLVLAGLAQPRTADELVRLLGWNAPRVLRVLAELELAGLVSRATGGRVERTLGRRSW